MFLCGFHNNKSILCNEECMYYRTCTRKDSRTLESSRNSKTKIKSKKDIFKAYGY